MRIPKNLGKRSKEMISQEESIDIKSRDGFEKNQISRRKRIFKKREIVADDPLERLKT